jgi:adenylate kinase family enzyme
MNSPLSTSNHPGNRIVVIGTTGSGKTTLAEQLAQLWQVPHIELDMLHWGPNWTKTPLDIFRERTRQAVMADAWVTDGNYSKVRDIIWGRADTIIWLDYSLPVILQRLFRRTTRRIFTREELWNGNRETFRGAFLSRDSLFLWALKTYPRRHNETPALLARPEHQHLSVIHMRSPRQTARWLQALRVSTQIGANTP